MGSISPLGMAGSAALTDQLGGKGYVAGMQAIAKMLGMSLQQLFQLLANGQSLDQVLSSHGKSVGQAVAAFLEAVQQPAGVAPTDVQLSRKPADGISRLFAMHAHRSHTRPGPRTSTSDWGLDALSSDLTWDSDESGQLIDASV